MAGRTGIARRVLALCAATALSAGMLLSDAGAANAASAQVTGTVTFKGVPQAGVFVGAYGADGLSMQLAVTNDDGTYTLAAPRYPHFLYANVDAAYQSDGPQVPGSLAVYFGAGGRSDLVYQDLKPIAADAGGQRLNIALPAATTVSGSDANLPAHSPVELRTDDGHRVVSSTTTDAGGRYSFDVAAGSYRLSVPTTGDYLAYTSKVFTVRSGHAVVVDAANSRGATFTGEADYGGPILNDLVTLTHPDGITEVTTTGWDGRYTFQGEPAGTYTVTIGGTGSSDGADTEFVPESRTFTGVEGGTKHTFDLAKGVPAGQIRGTFHPDASAQEAGYLISDAKTGATVTGLGELRVDQEGEPSGEERTADVEGYGLPSGTYRVVAFDDGAARYYDRTVIVKAGHDTALGAIRATKPTLTLRGTVTGGTTANTISIRSSDDALVKSAHVSPTGRFTVTGLVPARYSLYVKAAYQKTEKYRLNLTASTSGTYKHGVAIGKVTATSRVPSSTEDILCVFALSDGRSFGTTGPGAAPVVYGTTPGDYRITKTTVPVLREVQPGVPYHFGVSSSRSRFTVTVGKTVDLGKISIGVVR